MARVFAALVAVGCAFQASLSAAAETQERARIAAANMQDAVVVDCQLPGRLMMLGAQRQYLASGPLLRLSAIDCRTRGGEYKIGDLASGTLSLQRWLPLAEGGDAQAQYFVARIYANGMDGVPLDYSRAVQWYGRAAKQKYKPAMQELGFLYESGLGVPQDRLSALNLQREASGLGEELDYAWKLTAANEESARQIAALSEQLEASNSDVEALRNRLAESTDSLARSRGNLAKAERAVLQLRAQLKAQQDEAAGANSAAKIKDLQADLAAKENELVATRRDADQQRADLAAQQSELEARLHKAEAASRDMNELIGARQNETDALRARLAQSEQRLLQAQQELGGLRLAYRREVDQLAAERDELDRARAQAHDDAAGALLAAKEHQLELQTLRMQTLEAEIGKLRAAQPEALRAATAELETRHQQQARELQAARDELTALRGKSQAEKAALFAKMSDELAARTAELSSKQRQIESLESDSSQLKIELARLRAERAGAHDALAGEAERSRAALQAAQQKLADQHDALDQLRTEAAKERAALLAERNNLQQQLTDSKSANDALTVAMQKTIAAREEVIKAKQAQIDEFEKKLAAQPPAALPVAANVMRTPDTGAQSASAASMAPAADSVAYYALVIGNGNYRHMNGLATPVNDARSVASLLAQRYGFRVKTLLDATSDEILAALDRYSIDLQDSNRLLIYYAGHGGTRDGPPERAFWLGVNAEPRSQEGWISAELVTNKIKQIQAKHVLLVSDSCFSASITHPTTTTIRRELRAQRFKLQWDRRARMVLTSGQNTPVVDNSGDHTHSLFAKYFLSVLLENSDLMSGEQLAYELGSRMQKEAESMGLQQAPTYSSLLDADHAYGDFFFLPPAPTRVAALAY